MTAANAVVRRSAIIDGPYRYLLTRAWDDSRPHDLWIMLNPSTADHETDDPTIRRLTGFSRDWGSGGFSVVNLSAYRATDPKDLLAAQKRGVDVIGPRNDAIITAALSRTQGKIIAAWGAHADDQRAFAVRRMARIAGRRSVECLGTTKTGQPKHPLYIAATTAPEVFAA